MRRSRTAGALLSLSVLVSASIVTAEVKLGDDDPLSLSADFRLRLEQDWGSQRADGSQREDRLRLRVRARLGITWKATDSLTFGARLRSGSDDSHQSPHITVVDFDDGDTGDADFNLDKWYLQAKRDRLWAWTGRNSFPFWKQNEFVWDDDVTPVGVAGGWSRPLGANGEGGEGGDLGVRLAYLTLPVGMREFSGNLGGAQILYKSSGLTLAAALFDFDASETDPDALILRRGNGLRDYRIWVINAQARLSAHGRPLTLGADFFHNDEDYPASDLFAFTHRDQTDGYVASVTWGSTKARGDWLAGVYYAHIETLAVNASFAQDDWVRWGSATGTDASDLEGLELRYVRGLGKGQNLVARLYLVEAITSAQDGNRFRLDYNLKF